MLIVALGLAACAADGPAPPKADIAPATAVDDAGGSAPEAVAPPMSADEIRILWRAAPHAGTYVLDEKGENSRCARCHAPVSWIPAMDDLPESCATCKFEVEPPPPVISESDWSHVECQVCHPKDEAGPDIAWLEIAAIGEYSPVGSATELCDKCHLASDIAGHASVVVAGDHLGTACTQCHDPHGLQASCEASGCHEDVLGPALEITGHDPEHASVSCGACHDATGMQVGPGPDGGSWTTFLTAAEMDAGVARTSHNTQRSVACDRCHAAGNPWGLTSEVAAP